MKSWYCLVGFTVHLGEEISFVFERHIIFCFIGLIIYKVGVIFRGGYCSHSLPNHALKAFSFDNMLGLLVYHCVVVNNCN